MEILTETIRALDCALGEFGFRRDPNARQSLRDQFREDWFRHTAWRVDNIGLSYPRALSARMYPGQVVAHVEVLLPCVRGAPCEVLDGTSVHYLAGRQRYRLPTSLMNALAPNRFKAVLARDCTEALQWFDTFATPGVALEKLLGGQTKWGETKGRAVKLMAEYLAHATEQEHHEGIDDPG